MKAMLNRGRRVPDRHKARSQYRRLGPIYDRIAWVGMRYRQIAVDRLKLRRGEVVLDVACGTGLNFEHIIEKVGPSGRLIGIDLSPDMLKVARQRVQSAGWPNVLLLESPLETAEIPHAADAAIFSLTHDVMRSRPALENVIGQLKPGGRVSVLGAKWAPRWAIPVNLLVWIVSRAYITTLEGYDRPWTHLQALVPDLRIEPVLLGAGYVATGRKAALPTS